ncbi:hypothetical protein [Eisenibacter elegans]|jgi:hypothetical protein|uniref:hypothetical protein n=1 Tax=Eisenibacter elegans TaxID=997 RepID=UPI0003FC9705|nr:hypothetical protein [Eisenibacter elegans]
MQDLGLQFLKALYDAATHVRADAPTSVRFHVPRNTAEAGPNSGWLLKGINVYKIGEHLGLDPPKVDSLVAYYAHEDVDCLRTLFNHRFFFLTSKAVSQIQQTTV